MENGGCNGGEWRGTAPWCGYDKNDGCGAGWRKVRYSRTGDGKRCLTGYKIWCCPLRSGSPVVEAIQEQEGCADQTWTAQKEYEFEYHGRLLTGLPCIASQYSGVGMRATVKLFAKTSNQIVLKVENPKSVDVNHVLYPKERGPATSYKRDGWNWRNLYLPPLQDVSLDFFSFIAQGLNYN